MYPNTQTHKLDDSFFLLDEEFDLEDEELSLEQPISHALLIDEIGWEDQLDKGEEMSL